MVDPRSPLTVQLIDADPDAYQKLVVTGGTPTRAWQLLADVRAEQLPANATTSPMAGLAMLAGLWLWHDGLDECHRIVQKPPVESTTDSRDWTSTLAFWHAIMHRREGDFANSKYWWNRVGEHPVLPSLAGQAADVVNHLPSDRLIFKLVARGWNPNTLVDLVEAVHNRPDDPRHRVAVVLQQMEWRALFDYCAR